MKKSLSLFMSALLAVLMMTLGTPVAFGANYSGSCGDSVLWELDTLSGEMVISGSGDMADYTMSSYPGWNQYQQYIKSVTVSDGVLSVGDYSFYNSSGYKYKNLTSVSLGANVADIGSYAFRGCSSITSVSGGAAVKSIGSYAFRSCSSLVSFPFGSVGTIGNGAFSYCRSLDSVSFTTSLTEIRASAFIGCQSLESVSLPSSMTVLGASAFADCTSLLSVEYLVENKLAECQGVFNGSGADSGMSAVIGDKVTLIPPGLFNTCVNLKSVSIGSAVTEIGSKAFASSGLETVALPKSVAKIDTTAFRSCQSLVSFSVDNSNIVFMSGTGGELMNKDKTRLYNYPCGKTAQTYAVPSGVAIVDEGAFRDNKYLKTVTFPSTVTAVGAFAFADMPSLTSITLPSNVKTVSKYAFYACKNLSALNMQGVTAIGNYAFSDCDSLTSLTPPTTLKTIGNYAFSNCDALATVNLNSGLVSVGEYAFYNCNALTRLTTPENMSKISAYAFSYCESLISVTLGEGLAEIGSCAFLNCLALSEITIPASVTGIGSCAFGYKLSGEKYVALSFTVKYYSDTAGQTYAEKNTSFSSELVTDSADEIVIDDVPESGGIWDEIIHFDFIALIKRLISAVIDLLF